MLKGLLLLAALAAAAPMTGGGDVTITPDGDLWRVTVTGPRAGLASLCLAEGSRVRILHASAAVGEAVYERAGDEWKLVSGFEFKLRDSRKGPAPTDAERRDYLAAMGWVANADNSGESPRAFIIRSSRSPQFLGVTFLATSEPMTVSHWPASMDDGCREIKIAQGYLPPTARFQPERWHPLR
jgi:hypothetical protein